MKYLITNGARKEMYNLWTEKKKEEVWDGMKRLTSPGLIKNGI